jgi:DDE superfamily endonuclease
LRAYPASPTTLRRGIIDACRQARLLVLGDKGSPGAGGTVLTPYKGRGLPPAYVQANKAFNTLRAPGERAFAQLKTWKVLWHYRGCPTRVSDLVTTVCFLNDLQ